MKFDEMISIIEGKFLSKKEIIPQKNFPRFLYHATPNNRISGIRKYGLRPMCRDKMYCISRNGVYLAANITRANQYFLDFQDRLPIGQYEDEFDTKQEEKDYFEIMKDKWTFLQIDTSKINTNRLFVDKNEYDNYPNPLPGQKYKKIEKLGYMYDNLSSYIYKGIILPRSFRILSKKEANDLIQRETTQ